MSIKKIALVAVAVMGFATSGAQASVVTYTDRAAFEAAAAGYTLDNLNDVPNGFLPVGINRGPYSFTMNSFGCSSGPGQCGDSSAEGFFYPAYIYTYEAGSFNFTSAIHAFGLDYGHYYSPAASVTLDGYTANSDNGGFFGIINSDAMTSVTYSAQGQGSLFDNVTFSANANSSSVPEPESLALIGLGLAGLVINRRKGKQA